MIVTHLVSRVDQNRMEKDCLLEEVDHFFDIQNKINREDFRKYHAWQAEQALEQQGAETSKEMVNRVLIENRKQNTIMLQKLYDALRNMRHMGHAKSKYCGQWSGWNGA